MVWGILTKMLVLFLLLEASAAISLKMLKILFLRRLKRLNSSNMQQLAGRKLAGTQTSSKHHNAKVVSDLHHQHHNLQTAKKIVRFFHRHELISQNHHSQHHHSQNHHELISQNHQELISQMFHFLQLNHRFSLAEFMEQDGDNMWRARTGRSARNLTSQNKAHEHLEQHSRVRNSQRVRAPWVQ